MGTVCIKIPSIVLRDSLVTLSLQLGHLGDLHLHLLLGSAVTVPDDGEHTAEFLGRVLSILRGGSV